MISFDNNFFFDKNGFDFHNNKSFKKNLIEAKKESQKLLVEFKNGSNEILKSFTKSYQSKIRNLQKNLKNKNKKKVVIGLGGSSSGAKALSFFLNDETVFFDNLDYEHISNFFKKNDIKNYHYFIISKSGDTFETLAILNLLIVESLKIKDFNIYKFMTVITENKDSILKSFSDKNKIRLVEHNPLIGGRYSILSETGMLPFYNLNLKVENGSEKFIKYLSDDCELSPTVNAAILTTLIENMNIKIYCNLIYNYKLKHFSYWFHQLHAESLGKNQKGMTPMTSICPKDHHSMMQLYLDGPMDKIFNIFSPSDDKCYDKFLKLGFKNIENYSPAGLLKKQFESVIEVFKEKKIPYRAIYLKNYKDPLNLVELFSYFILETILLGKILKVNPYDQPEVQLIKNKIFKG